MKKARLPAEEIDTLLSKYTPTKRFIMLAERLEQENAPKMDIADCYLKASWAERMASADFLFVKRRKQESKDLEKHCQKKAVEYFSNALKEQETEETPDLLYLIGELYRRTGNFRRAIEYFEKAKKALKPDVPPESKSFLILIEQMNLLALKKDGSHKVIEKLRD